MKNAPTTINSRSATQGYRQDNYTTESISVSTAAQRARILDHLKSGKALTTLYARQHLNVMHPAARVMELRKAGHKIITQRRRDTDTEGRPHIVAEYVLLQGCEDGRGLDKVLEGISYA